MLITLSFPETLVPPDSIRTLEVYPPPGQGSLAAVRILIPEDCRGGVKVKGFSAVNAGQPVPFFYGRDFLGELFDGDEGRDVPYGLLPRVPADPDTPFTLTIHNPSLTPRMFRAEVKVESQDHPSGATS